MQAPNPGGIIKIMYALTCKYRNGLIYWAFPRLFFFSVLLMMPRVTISTHPLERLQWRSPHPRSCMSDESRGGEHCHRHRPSRPPQEGAADAEPPLMAPGPTMRESHPAWRRSRWAPDLQIMLETGFGLRRIVPLDSCLLLFLFSKGCVKLIKGDSKTIYN